VSILLVSIWRGSLSLKIALPGYEHSAYTS
jgi:hypothetical protein